MRGRTAGMSLSRSVIDDEFVEHAEPAEDAVSLRSSTVKSLRPPLCVNKGGLRDESVGGLPARTRGCSSPMASNAESVICPDEAHVDDNGNSRKGAGSAKCGTSSDRRTATLVRWRHSSKRVDGAKVTTGLPQERSGEVLCQRGGRVPAMSGDALRVGREVKRRAAGIGSGVRSCVGGENASVDFSVASDGEQEKSWRLAWTASAMTAADASSTTGGASGCASPQSPSHMSASEYMQRTRDRLVLPSRAFDLLRSLRAPWSTGAAAVYAHTHAHAPTRVDGSCAERQVKIEGGGWGKYRPQGGGKARPSRHTVGQEADGRETGTADNGAQKQNETRKGVTACACVALRVGPQRRRGRGGH